MELTQDQKKALDALNSDRNVFITGDAGCGKSFVISQFLKDRDDVMICAPTGIAAVNIGGTTIHQTFRVPIGPALEQPASAPAALQDASAVLIDEISMVRADVFDYVSEQIQMENRSRIHRGEAPVRLIVVGDFFQLPPVVRTDTGGDFSDAQLLADHYSIRCSDLGGCYAFQSPYWKLWNFECVAMKEVVRQSDTEFSLCLSYLRRGDPCGLNYLKFHSRMRSLPDAIEICDTNARANAVNARKVRQITGNFRTYQAKVAGKFSEKEYPTVSKLVLKKGTRVMALINNINEGYINGSLGTVTALKQDAVQVRFDNGSSATLSYHEWHSSRYVARRQRSLKKKLLCETTGTFSQIPLKIAYAITAHKSQGQTFDAVNIHPNSFAPGQLYVGLSRVKSIENLHIYGRISRKDLLCDQEVRRFMDDPESYQTHYHPVWQNQKNQSSVSIFSRIKEALYTRRTS